MQCKTVVPFRDVFAEVNAQGERIGLNRGKAPLNQFVKLIVHYPDKGLRFQVLNGGNIGQGLMAARRCKKRDIISDALVAVRFAQVEYPACRIWL